MVPSSHGRADSSPSAPAGQVVEDLRCRDLSIVREHFGVSVVEAPEELSELGRRREVLVFLSDGHHLDTEPRCKAIDHLGDETIGGRGTGGDTDDAAEIIRKLGGLIHPDHSWAPRVGRDLGKRNGVRGIGGADHHHDVCSAGDGSQCSLSVGGRETQVAPIRHPEVGETCSRHLHQIPPLIVAQGRLSEERHGCSGRNRRSSAFEIRFRLDEVHDIWRHCHRADGLFMSGMADIEDLVALPRPNLELMMHLGDQRADRINDDAPVLSSGLDHCRGRAMGAEHQRGPGGDLVDVVDEDHPLFDEAVHDVLVVNDLVVAVHRWLEHGHHPGQRLDRLLHSRTKASRFSKEHSIDVHGVETTAERRRATHRPA